MILKDVKDAYDYFSGTLSGIVRQLAFAGIAIVWIFKTDVNGIPHFDGLLLWVAIFTLGSLAFDLLHYIAGSLIWGVYLQYLDWKGRTTDEEFKPYRIINWTTLFFFIFKTIFMVISYILLFIFLSNLVNRE